MRKPGKLTGFRFAKFNGMTGFYQVGISNSCVLPLSGLAGHLPTTRCTAVIQAVARADSDSAVPRAESMSKARAARRDHRPSPST